MKTCSHDRGTNFFPLYIDLDKTRVNRNSFGEGLFNAKSHRASNTSKDFVSDLQEKLGLKFVPNGVGDLSTSFGPADILHYMYAVFHSPGYRSRYAELLRTDFPHLPLTSSVEFFHALSRFGKDLVALHLMESPKLDKQITKFVGKELEVEKVTYSNNTVWIDKAQTSGFTGVPENVWDFHIGGYQVCEKWLKDRKGRTLSKEDIEHYHRIVVALNETIRLMAEIDKVIDAHGGWPIT